MIKELILKNRSYRRYYEETPIERQQLLNWIDLARLSASGANLQSLKYFLSFDHTRNDMIFPTLKWAGYLKEWDGPPVGERPSAYIIVLSDKEIRPTSSGYDIGIACQSILLGATEAGFGGCIFGSVELVLLRKAMKIPERFEISLVIALGRPKEQIVIEQVGPDGDVKYYRDEKSVHHVPKRRLEDLIVTP